MGRITADGKGMMHSFLLLGGPGHGEWVEIEILYSEEEGYYAPPPPTFNYEVLPPPILIAWKPTYRPRTDDVGIHQYKSLELIITSQGETKRKWAYRSHDLSEEATVLLYDRVKYESERRRHEEALKKQREKYFVELER